MKKRADAASTKPISARDRGPLQREQDNKKSGSSATPMEPGRAEAKNSYGPFGRGDREPQSRGKAPGKN